MKHTINYLGHEFEYKFNYSPGRPATHEDPAEYEEYEIYDITLNGIDATDLLGRQIDDFEETVIKYLKE
jgi:hypothetical protein